MPSRLSRWFVGIGGRECDEVAVGLEVLYELGVETVSGERFGIADNDEFHSGASNGDIHAS